MIQKGAAAVAAVLLLSVALGLLGGEGAAGPRVAGDLLPDNRGSDAMPTGQSEPFGQGSDWTPVEPATSPSGRAFSSMAYDTESDRVILFGGLTGRMSNQDTWAYDFDTNVWKEMNPATSPDRRDAHAMAYDAQSDRVILFGGENVDGDTSYSDTWAYDFNTNTWTDMNPISSPTARLSHGMVYDARSDRIILFGGLSAPRSAVYYDETWAYDFDTNAWTQLSPSTKPFGRICFALAYDAESGRVILFGAETSEGLSADDTWAYDYNTNTWTDMNPAPRPSVQAYQAMAYEAASDRVILFGGAGGAETWAYDFNKNAWTNMTSVAHLSGRWGHAMAYDEGSDRVVLFGGLPGPTDDTWAYDSASDAWTPMIVSPTVPENLRAQAGDGHVTITWDAPSFAGSSQVSAYRIHRSTGAAASSQLAEVESRMFVDVSVTNEILYLYTVTAVNGEREGSHSNRVFAIPVDIDPPTLVITRPTQGETLTSTTVTVTGTASDNSSVRKVEISTDEITWMEAVGTTSWTDQLTLAEGPHTIYARAFDAVGREGGASVSIMVELPAPSPPPPPIWLWAVIAPAIGVAGIAVFFWIRRIRPGDR